jgi:hypothetical protein
MWKGTTNISLRVAGNLSSWTIYSYTLKQTINASNRYIYIPIARARLHLQYYIIRFRVNNTDMPIRKFEIEDA